jgi:hypothetical protein
LISSSASRNTAGTDPGKKAHYMRCMRVAPRAST